MRGEPISDGAVKPLSIRRTVRFALAAYVSFILTVFAILLFGVRQAPFTSLAVFGCVLVAASLTLSWYVLYTFRQPVEELLERSRGLAEVGEQKKRGDGEFHHLASAFDEISGRLVDTRETLLKEESRTRALLEHTVDAIVSTDAGGAILTANAATKKLFGHDPDALIGMNVRTLAGGTDRLHHDQYIQSHLETGEKRIIGRPREVLGQRADGTTFPVDLSVARMQVEGEVIFIGVMRDLTDRVALEEQLRQAQKMEAVGQLTGGVAHDFNNLLAVVQGNLEMLRSDMQSDGPLNRENLLELCTESLHATRRGADLTQGLLAFSRKQTLKPELFDVNEAIDRMENLLRRTLGETIDLKIAKKEGGWQVKADPAQLESAILNLAVNANDAMGHVGTLTIETTDTTLDEHYAATHEEVEPGEYVLIAVSDNGPGISEAVLKRVLEPFFTTKEVGEGSGLGLSMIYGYAKQSRGHLSIYSEEGIGTTVKLYLPRSLSKNEARTEPERSDANVDGSEVILVVEDDEALRRTVMRILKRKGYEVLVAQDGPDALLQLDTADHIDLILSDVILPGGMNGPQLIAEAVKSHRDIKVLLMSGYTKEAIMHRGDISEDVRLIHKPFSPQDLGVALRDILGER